MRTSKKAYRKYIQAGMDQGNRRELVGGGLICSLRGWSEVISARKHGARELSDERILGNTDFVEQVIQGADERLSLQFDGIVRKQKIADILEKICDQEDIINALELKTVSRRGFVCRVRSQLAHELDENYRIPLAEVAQHVGVSTSAISKMLSKQCMIIESTKSTTPLAS